MALHGPIQVNGEVIGRWVARRTTPNLDPDGTAVYECEVGTPPWTDIVSFDLRHRHNDGAVVLAAKVLAEAARLRGLDGAP